MKMEFSLLAMIFTFNRPMRRLQQGAMALADGDFDTTIDLRSNDELGDMADTFNQMSAQFKKHYDEGSCQRNTELEMVYQIAQAITASSNDPVATLNTILDRAHQMIPTKKEKSVCTCPEENALRVRAWKGQTGSIDWRERQIPVGTGSPEVSARAAAASCRLIFALEPSVKPVYGDVVTNPVRSYVGVPLLVEDRLVGTMQVVSTQAGRLTSTRDGSWRRSPCKRRWPSRRRRKSRRQSTRSKLRSPNLKTSGTKPGERIRLPRSRRRSSSPSSRSRPRG